MVINALSGFISKYRRLPNLHFPCHSFFLKKDHLKDTNYFNSLSPFLSKSISLQQLDLIVIDLPQKIVFQSGIGIRKSRQALLVKWTDLDGNIGYGECSCRPDPYYSAEFMEAAILLIQHFVFPQLKKEQTYGEVLAILKKIRGWQFTKAAVEFAMHDLIHKRDGDSIFDHWQRPQLDKIPVGISLGIQENEAILKKVVIEAKAEGYQRLKFKISPTKVAAEQFTRVPEIFTDTYLTFDANGTYEAADMEKLRPFADFKTMIEQPFPPNRIDIVQAGKQHLPHLTICLDEEVKSIGNLVTAHQLGIIDELNLKLGRVGGIVNSIQIAEYCLQHAIPCWIGGMFETGIGRSLNIQFAAFLPHAKAHDLSPSTRYFVEDILKKPVEMDDNGFIEVNSVRGSEVNEQLVQKYEEQRVCLPFS